ncbi:MAG: c-type cytochrome biogenesis protein CcmI [Rhodoferax sp.]|nr:c-type cytochrome biogenesis protein CcmI [Rhodoferax sp.]
MTLFLTIGGLGGLLVLALLLRPFLFKRAATGVSRRQLNAAIYRDQFERLARDRDENMLTQADYVQAKEELQRRVLEDASEEEAAVTLETPKKTLVLVGLLIPAMAIGLYWHLGSPAALDPATAAQPAQAAGQHHTTPQEIERLVAGLVKKLEQDPGNLQGWSMLARTYKMLGRNAEAEQAFERAGTFLDNDAQLLASYADLAAANANGNFAGKPNQLIAKALKADPDNPMALWLAGTAAFRSSDFGTAIRLWERLLAKLDPNAEDTQMLQGAIEDAYARMGKPVPDKLGTKTPPSSPTGEDTKAPAGASVSGVVDLDKAFKGRVAATDAVLVIARIPGMRMPAAVLRARAADLPISFTLDDSLSMSPQARLSNASQVEVEARISKSGMAQSEPGDLISAVQTVRVGASGVQLHVNQVRP